MDYIYIGRITNTHGLKGEIKIKSNFLYKEKVFIKDFNLYIGKNKNKEIIKTYRPHQEYDMITLNNINTIEDVLKYKGSLVFINKEDLKLNENEYVDEDYINCNCIFENQNIGKVEKIIDSGNGNYLLCLSNNKYIPRNNNFIEKIDLDNKEIYLKNVEGLI